MELALPSAEYKDSFIEAVKEFQADAAYMYTQRTRRYSDLSIQELQDHFEHFVARELAHADKNQPDGQIPETIYWLVDDGEFVGSTGVRHALNERLDLIGGHIGYDIRPSKRGKGYGNKILELALQKAKERGLARVLLTVAEQNAPSRKIIEKNGGVLEDKNFIPDMNFVALRYWIDVR